MLRRNLSSSFSFETWFLSNALTTEDLDKTIEATSNFFEINRRAVLIGNANLHLASYPASCI
jgi:hypothetical protein